jgi:hypothetical protein
MSLIGIAVALAWLVQPSVRAVRRPRPAAASDSAQDEPAESPVATVL